MFDDNKRIKVALCYSGAVRGLLVNLPQLKDAIFHEDRYDIDYYFYGDPIGASIRQDDITKGRAEPQGLKIKKEMPEFNCLFEDETEGFEERLANFRTKIFQYHMPYEQQVLQWYGVQRVFDFVLSQDKEYDVYVRVRPDIYPAGKMKFDWSTFDENTVYAPFMGNFGGLNDRFAFGSKKAMRIYSNFYDSQVYYRGPSGDLNEKSRKYFEKIYKEVPVERMHPNIDDPAARQKWCNDHRSAYVYGCGRNNSELRLFSHLVDNDLDIHVLDPEYIHIGAVRNADKFIRYFGPEFEGLLLKYNQATKEELKYDGRVWW